MAFSIEGRAELQSGVTPEVMFIAGLVIWRSKSLSVACARFGRKRAISRTARVRNDRRILVSLGSENLLQSLGYHGNQDLSTCLYALAVLRRDWQARPGSRRSHSDTLSLDHHGRCG